MWRLAIKAAVQQLLRKLSGTFVQVDNFMEAFFSPERHKLEREIFCSWRLERGQQAGDSYKILNHQSGRHKIFSKIMESSSSFFHSVATQSSSYKIKQGSPFWIGGALD